MLNLLRTIKQYKLIFVHSYRKLTREEVKSEWAYWGDFENPRPRWEQHFAKKLSDICYSIKKFDFKNYVKPCKHCIKSNK